MAPTAEPDWSTWGDGGHRYGRCVHCDRLIVRRHGEGPWQHNVSGEAVCPDEYLTR